MNHVDDSCPEGPFPEPMTYSDFFGAAREGLKLGPDRHPKWQRVEPGTVIPAGQPHRVEWAEWDEMYASEYVINESFTVTTERTPYFIDSSWKPPLVLPTEPTWGIALHRERGEMLGRWNVYDGTLFLRTNVPHTTSRNLILDFIPLTDEQVARIEAAR